MAESVTIFEIDPVEVAGFRFHLSLDHIANLGYVITVMPHAQNLAPEAEEGMLVLGSPPGSPEAIQKTIDRSPKFSAAIANELKGEALWAACEIIAGMIKVYGVEKDQRQVAIGLHGLDIPTGNLLTHFWASFYLVRLGPKRFELLMPPANGSLKGVPCPSDGFAVSWYGANPWSAGPTGIIKTLLSFPEYEGCEISQQYGDNPMDWPEAVDPGATPATAPEPNYPVPAIALTNLASFKRALQAHQYWLFDYHKTLTVTPNVGPKTTLASPGQSLRRVKSVSSSTAIFAKPPSGGSTRMDFGKASEWQFEGASATNMDDLHPDQPLMTYTAISQEEFLARLREMFPEKTDDVIAAMEGTNQPD